MESSPLYDLPVETLHQIFSIVPVRQIIISRSVCKYLNHTLSSPPFLHLISTLPPPPFPLLALRPYRRHVSPGYTLRVFDPDHCHWLKLPLSFLPFESVQPVDSSFGLVYAWVDSPGSGKSLVVFNPLVQSFKVLPPVRSEWWAHGSVVLGFPNRVLITTQSFTLYYSNSKNKWITFSSNLPSKPKSPILIKDSIFVLCEFNNKYKLYRCSLRDPSRWKPIEKIGWGIVFQLLNRPRLVKGMGDKILMIGELKSSFSLDCSKSRISIFRLDLRSLEWDEAGRMPIDIYKHFQGLGKLKVFGNGARVCFSGRKLRGVAVWEFSGEWRWIKCVTPVEHNAFYRGFMYEPHLTALP